MSEEMMDKLSGGSNLTKEEKQLQKLFAEKQELMIKQNQEFLNQLFKDNRNKPVNVRGVNVNSQEIRPSFLEAQLSSITNENSFTLKGFFDALDEINTNLVNANILQNYSINLNVLQSFNDTLNVAPIFNLTPVKRFFAKTGSNIGNGEGDGYIQFELRNLFGGGENLMFDATTGTRTSASYMLNYSQPLFNNTKYFIENLFYVNQRSLEWIGSESKVRGHNLRLYTKMKKLNHELNFENVWRILMNKSSKSLQILNSAGNNYKSSLSYNVKYDTRDSSHLPTSGSMFRLGLEYARPVKVFGSPSNLHSHFFKTVLESQFAIPVSENHNLIFTNKGGVLKSFNSASFILDRFFIGGPNDVRSFTMNGLGPKSYNNSLGGDLYVNGGISLISKIPYTSQGSNFKLHNFLNYGGVSLFEPKETLVNNVKRLTPLSVSTGFGVLYNHPMARFELNFVLPLAIHERDYSRKGLQYGVGVSFL